MMRLLAYADGQQDLLSIVGIINIPSWEILTIVVEKLERHGLINSIKSDQKDDC